MIQLIYYSVASPSLKKSDISIILEVSQKNNLKKGITGCMLYYNDAFLQILEGRQEDIDFLYGKIEQDERHYSIRQVYNDVIEQRLFKDWSMAFYDLDKGEKGKLNFRRDFIAIAGQTAEPTIASELFWDISNQLLDE